MSYHHYNWISFWILNVLKKAKINIISSGGTSKEIKKLGYKCTEVSDYTNTVEILDGRVKTLHPKLYAGILSKRDNKNHKKELKKYNHEEIDLVIGKVMVVLTQTAVRGVT